MQLHTNLITALKEKNRIRSRYKKYGNPRDELEYKLLGMRCRKLAKKSYKSYVSSAEDNILKNSKHFWTFIKNKRKTSSTFPATMIHKEESACEGVDICNMFAMFFKSVYVNYNTSDTADSPEETTVSLTSDSFTTILLTSEVIFQKLKDIDINKGAGPDGIPPIFISHCASALTTPLTIIYNTSISMGIFPCKWKSAKVVPIPKTGDKSQVSNYRPISILSSFGKILESLVSPYLQAYFQKYITDNQHGFTVSRSTCTNLVSFVETVISCIDNHQEADVIYTDFSKAFDKVSHTILLKKLEDYGVSGNILKWIESYLNERYFYVVVNGYKSDLYEINSGVPQGSHLGPILFNIFVNDLPNCLQYSTPFMFADDLKLLRIINSTEDVFLLQQDLNSLGGWCVLNGMDLNASKCMHIRFSRKSNKIPAEYAINGNKVIETNCVRDLGVLIDSKVTFQDHYENILKKAFNMLGFIIRNGKVFNKTSTKITLFNSYVRSLLEYCSTVWRPHYSTHSLRLERVQKRFLWHLCYRTNLSKRHVSYGERLRHFGVDSLAKRRDILDLMFLYKLIHYKIDCPQLLSRVNFRVPANYPRSRITIFSPPLRKTVLGSTSPIPRIVKLYNKYSSTLDIFANSLSKFRRILHIMLPSDTF